MKGWVFENDWGVVRIILVCPGGLCENGLPIVVCPSGHTEREFFENIPPVYMYKHPIPATPHQG